jgi:hypothetical protein
MLIGSRPVSIASVRSLRGFPLRHWSRGEMSFLGVSDLNDAELAELKRARALRQ